LYWKFPHIPEGLMITDPYGTDSITSFSKTDSLRFEFYALHRLEPLKSWTYEPHLSEPAYRWLFDSSGYQKIEIACKYEPWVGRDVVQIWTNEKFQVDKYSFELLDVHGRVISTEVVTKQDSTDKIVLLIDENYPEGEVLYVSFVAHAGIRYEEAIVVPDRSVMGLLWKLNDL